MPITLITGLPGHGKTLYTLDRFRAEAEKASRPVFHNNIPGLNIPGWQPFEVQEWEKLPAGALAIIDEAWKCFPVTGRGQTPAWVQNLATHRHLGIDLVCIVQQPMLLDSFVRRLIDRHFHVVRKFGMAWATVYECPTGVIEDVQKPGSRKEMIRHEYRYNKEVFSWYTSAELHTVKTRLPARVWLLLAAAIGFPIACALAWHQLKPSTAKERLDAQLGNTPAATAPAGFATGQANSAGTASRQTMTPAEYTAAYTPRFEGLAHTAPIYDGVTAPQQAPYPAACIANNKRCQCYSQQSTRLDMPDALCRKLADGGFFVAWAPDGSRMQAEQRQQAAREPTEHQQGGATNFGPSQAPQFVAEASDPDAGNLPRRVRRVTRQ